MSKIICDVCGTKYPESAEQCPICGRAGSGDKIPDTDEVEGTYGREYSRTKGGHFSKSNVKKRTDGAPIVEVPEEPAKPEPVEEEEEVFEVPEKKKSGCLVNFLLVIVILALLAVSAYIAVTYVAPNMLDDFNLNLDFLTQQQTEATTEATEEPTTEEMPTEESTEESTAPTVPCTDLVILDSLVMIDEVGQSYLLNAAVAPEDTTDTLMYSSSDDSIATVNSEGRITAVSAGQAIITVSCGEISVECTVLAAPGDITLPAEGAETTATEATEATTATEAASGETTATEATKATEATEATEATTAPTKPVQLKDVKLSVKKTDVTFVHRGQKATFKLTCALAANEVTWTSQDESIITVDENGVATCTGYGTTNVIVSYGDQQVTIIVRCTKK